jgi:hypothetical protein
MYLQPTFALKITRSWISIYVSVDQSIQQEDDSFNQHRCDDIKSYTYVIKFPPFRMQDLASQHNKTTGKFVPVHAMEAYGEMDM